MNIKVKIKDTTSVAFPIIIKDKSGDVAYWQNLNGSWLKKTYDDNGKLLTYKNSDGYWSVETYDDNGKKLTFKNSDGYYKIKGSFVTKEEYEEFFNPIPEYTMEELIAKIGNFKLKNI
jgi:hypothetical protein